MSALADLEQFAKPVEKLSTGLTWGERFPAEYEWIQTSTFGFAKSMRDALTRWPELTKGQLEAVRKCMAFDSRPAVVYAPASIDPTGLDLSKVPAGNYAVPDGNTRLKITISKPTEGMWAGHIFVRDAAAYGKGARYGMQFPGSTYQGQIREQLALIAHDPAAASAAYGKLTGHCGICNRPLENEGSVARGIGPICAGRLGW